MTDAQPYCYKIITAQEDGSLRDSEPVRFPAGLQVGDMFRYLTALFGEPIEDAVTDTAEFGRVRVGWVFRSRPDADGPVRDLTIIPLIDDPEDRATPISMFVHQERLRTDFTAAMTDAGVPVETITPEPGSHLEPV